MDDDHDQPQTSTSAEWGSLFAVIAFVNIVAGAVAGQLAYVRAGVVLFVVSLVCAWIDLYFKDRDSYPG